MISEASVLKFVKQLVKNSGVNLALLDSDRKILLNLLNDMPKGCVVEGVDARKRFSVFSGCTFMKFNFGVDTLYVGAAGTSETASSFCSFYAMLLEMYAKSGAADQLGEQEVFKRLIKGQFSEMEILQMNIEMNRCLRVLVMSIIPEKINEAFDVIKSAFPENNENSIFCYDSSRVVLVCEVTEETDDEYFIQMASAVCDSVETEVSTDALIGIGNSIAHLTQLEQSFHEAEKALMIGKLTKLNRSVLLYNQLKLERLLCTIPADIAKTYYEEMNRSEYKKLLTEEMMLTITIFFENNLNLSETARQLFIHRNTLVYRLDKIQRVTGLDLRNFNDAVLFKLMSVMQQMNMENAF